MAMESQENPRLAEGWWERPWIGQMLLGAAALGFIFLCMILPLVGPAGVTEAHSARNAQAFSAVLGLTLALAAAAFAAKHRRMRRYGDPFPRVSAGLCVLLLLMLLAYAAGLLRA